MTPTKRISSASIKAHRLCDEAIRTLTKLRDDLSPELPEYTIAGNALQDLYRAKSHLTINISRTRQ